MVTVRLRGIFKVKSKGREYHYAWRGGPRLHGEPGSPEYLASFQEAHAQHRAPTAGRFAAVVAGYRASPDYLNLAESTRRNWARWLDEIAAHFGELQTAQFDRPEKIRPLIRKWRNRWAATPRTADYALQVLSRVLSYAVDPLGSIAGNPCEGIKQLYAGSNRAEIIWSEADIVELKATCSPSIANAVDLAAATGLRLGDLVKVSWSHVGDNQIIIRTGKSRGRREAIVPLYDDLRALLARIPRQATTILTSSRQRPWTVDGFGSSFNKAKIDAGMADRDLHFHDLKGTAVTRFYVAGLSERVIAEIVGWEEATVHRIIRRYVGRNAATRAIIEQINRTGKRT